MLIKTNDLVQILCGDDRGARGKVLRVDRSARKVVVEGVNRTRKHVRRSQRNPRGGVLSMEMPLPVSNVLLVCRGCNAAARMGARYQADGSKERYCKKCGAGNGLVAPAKTRYAKK
ncbi:MAG: 50S ribosomal protein L24 [Pirellulales bacterium]|nr:50S ribosomal protein L24 [Pirellulales bacterium]